MSPVEVQGEPIMEASQADETTNTRSPDQLHTVSNSQPTVNQSTGLSIDGDLNVGKTVIRQHLEAFFEFVYPIPCYNFIHRAILFQDWSQGRHNPRLLQAICGVSARFVQSSDTENPSKGRDVANKWLQDAEMSLLSRLGAPTISDVEALMLVTLDHTVARRFSKMMVTGGLCARLAYMMGLNYEDKRLGFLAQERRRRLMWSIYIMDTFYSSGRAEFTVCPRGTMHIQLPCREKAFNFNIPTVTGPLRSTPPSEPALAPASAIPPVTAHTPAPAQSSPMSSLSSSSRPLMRSMAGDLSLMAYCIRLLDIRDRVQRLVQTIVNHREPLLSCLSRVEGLVGELSNLQQSLPVKYALEPKTLFFRAYTPQRTTFVMFHLWFHQIHCDLFRFTTPGFREALPLEELQNLPGDFVSSCQQKCLEHALMVSEVFSMVQELSRDIFVTDPSLAMCAFHSARVISRLGFSPVGMLTRSELLTRLKTCASILDIPANIYPTTKLLQNGILDLIHDASTSPRSSSPMRSNWIQEGSEDENDPEERDSEDRLRAASTRLRERSRREVYSRFSVTDEIRRLRFQHEEDHNSADGDNIPGPQSGRNAPKQQPVPDYQDMPGYHTPRYSFSRLPTAPILNPTYPTDQRSQYPRQVGSAAPGGGVELDDTGVYFNAENLNTDVSTSRDVLTTLQLFSDPQYHQPSSFWDGSLPAQQHDAMIPWLDEYNPVYN